jgi:pimeloyl-ACP methyl ester carboxylesterase
MAKIPDSCTGYAQSGQKFEMKTEPLRHCIEDACAPIFPDSSGPIEYTYLTAPRRLDPSDIPGEEAPHCDDWDMWGWWRDLDGSGVDLREPLAALSTVVKSSGPFDAVVGFSQGAALAAIFTSLCEQQGFSERRNALEEQGRPISCDLGQGHLKFAIFISGYCISKSLYGGFYHPRIQTPVLLIAGLLDPVIPPDRTREMLETCDNAFLIEHHGTHYVPRFGPALHQLKDYLSNTFTQRHHPSAIL